MATFGVSIPNDLSQELDELTETWRTNRSQAIVRIYLEWRQLQQALNLGIGVEALELGNSKPKREMVEEPA